VSGFFGTLALVLAGIGLFGVTAYAVASGRTKIAIRMALGAPALGAMRPVLERTALLIGAGILAGSAGSLWAAQFVQTLIDGIEPHELVTLAAAAFVLCVVAGAAAWLPARRAARVDPATILREG